jgi:hypothetical protein
MQYAHRFGVPMNVARLVNMCLKSLEQNPHR